MPAFVNVLCTILRAGMSVGGRARANDRSNYKADRTRKRGHRCGPRGSLRTRQFWRLTKRLRFGEWRSAVKRRFDSKPFAARVQRVTILWRGTGARSSSEKEIAGRAKAVRRKNSERGNRAQAVAWARW